MSHVRFHSLHVEAFQPQSEDRLRQQRVRSLLALTLILWGSNFILQTLGMALAGAPHLLEIVGACLLTTIFGLFLCFLIHLLLSKIRTTRRRLIALALVAPVAAEIFAWAVYFSVAAVDPSVTARHFSWSVAIRTVSFWTWYFLAWAGCYLALSYSFDAQEEQRQTAELREQAHIARLRALHSQINPHFLFNSLNSVSALIIDGKIESADLMVTKLAKFLRLGLAADPTHKIPLESELQLQKIYLELEQLRYEDLKVSFAVPDELLGAGVPALILQPIVENAVKYGVASSPPPALITIEAWKEAGRLHLLVTDSGQSKTQAGSGAGIGLSNVLQRLRLIYGDQSADLRAEHAPGGGYRVELRFPLEQL